MTIEECINRKVYAIKELVSGGKLLDKAVQIVPQTLTAEERQQVLTNLGISGDAAFKYIVLSELPQTGEENVIYLIGPDQTSTGPDKYEEYVWYNDVFVKIGDTSVDLAQKEDKSNKVTTVSSSSTNDQYPSAKAVYDIIPTQVELTTSIINSLWEAAS